jgi:hypothetical protein
MASGLIFMELPRVRSAAKGEASMPEFPFASCAGLMGRTTIKTWLKTDLRYGLVSHEARSRGASTNAPNLCRLKWCIAFLKNDYHNIVSDVSLLFQLLLVVVFIRKKG